MRTSDNGPEDERSLKRVKCAASLQEGLKVSASVAAQTVSLYDTLLNEVVKELILDTYRTPGAPMGEIGRDPYRSCTQSPAQTWRPTLDAFGQPRDIALKAEGALCTSCQRRIPATRFVQHLEKCTGRGRLADRNLYRKYIQDSEEN